MTFDLSQINYLAVLVLGIATFLLGGFDVSYQLIYLVMMGAVFAYWR